eukprot:jgi/Botrbrau1/12275/Bobra.0323s0015.1
MTAARLRHLQPGHSVVKSNVSKWIREDPNKALAEAEAAQVAADAARFDVVRQLSAVEGRKRYEFLEALTGSMEAHLAFFERGVKVMRGLEPQLDWAKGEVTRLRDEQRRRQEALEQAMVEYTATRAQRAERLTTNLSSTTSVGGPLQMTSALGGMASDFEAYMRATANGRGGGLGVLKQGYLLKRSSNNVYRDWKRRFFVLDSTGMLYYYSSKEKQGEKKTAQNTVNLLTATVKVDSEDPALRFCFRVISPEKTYTLQADNDLDRSEWMSAIQGVIACLLNGTIEPAQQAVPPVTGRGSLAARTGRHSRHSSTSELAGAGEGVGALAQVTGLRGEGLAPRSPSVPRFSSAALLDSPGKPPLGHTIRRGGGSEPLEVLRRVAGNDVCCDCGAPDPDWASLNLAVLLCIECSGIHRQLGVHVSKVRSLTLDVRVWEEGGIMDMMSSLGNEAGNEVWEAALHHINQRADSWVWTDDSEEERSPSSALASDASSPFHLTTPLTRNGSAAPDTGMPYAKPNPKHALAVKEQYVRAKYVERRFVIPHPGGPAGAQAALWEAVLASDIRGTMRAVIGGANVNYNYTGQAAAAAVADAEAHAHPGGPSEAVVPSMADEGCDGVTVLHLACRGGPPRVQEYLLQNGASHSAKDARGRTPLHYAVLYDSVNAAKSLLLRGANKEARDASGATPLEAAMCKGRITDEDLFMMLS